MCSLLRILEILQKHFFLDCAHLVPGSLLLVKAQSIAEPSGMPCLGNSGVLKGKAGLNWDPSTVTSWLRSGVRFLAGAGAGRRGHHSEEFLPSPSMKSAEKPAGRHSAHFREASCLVHTPSQESAAGHPKTH